MTVRRKSYVLDYPSNEHPQIKRQQRRYTPPTTGGENERNQSADRRIFAWHTQIELNGALKRAEAKTRATNVLSRISILHPVKQSPNPNSRDRKQLRDPARFVSLSEWLENPKNRTRR